MTSKRSALYTYTAIQALKRILVTKLYSRCVLETLSVLISYQFWWHIIYRFQDIRVNETIAHRNLLTKLQHSSLSNKSVQLRTFIVQEKRNESKRSIRSCKILWMNRKHEWQVISFQAQATKVCERKEYGWNSGREGWTNHLMMLPRRSIWRHPPPVDWLERLAGQPFQQRTP